MCLQMSALGGVVANYMRLWARPYLRLGNISKPFAPCDTQAPHIGAALLHTCVLPFCFAQVSKDTAFRFVLTPADRADRINAFIPRALPEQEPYKCSYVQVGALLKQRGVGFDKLPSVCAGIVWEIEVKSEVPRTLKPLKPKFWLLGKFVLEAGKAYLMK